MFTIIIKYCTALVYIKGHPSILANLSPINSPWATECMAMDNEMWVLRILYSTVL